MSPADRILKIKINTSSITAEDIDDILRWEDEGGHPAQTPNSLSILSLPLHKEEIFEVVDDEIIIENGELYQRVGISLLSHH